MYQVKINELDCSEIVVPTKEQAEQLINEYKTQDKYYTLKFTYSLTKL